jgi:hypothetical protein
METSLSSKAIAPLPGFRTIVTALALVLGAPLAAQNDTAATGAVTEAAPTPPEPAKPVNVLVTIPRGEVNQAQAKECVDRVDAGAISGEIVVCRDVGDDGSNSLSASRAEAQKRYAQETAFKGAPPPPDVFGIPDNGKGIGFGGVPPPAVFIDVEALPKAPAGSDADRIARGLPPLNEEEELSEEQEKARREAAGIKTVVPPRAGKKKKN